MRLVGMLLFLLTVWLAPSRAEAQCCPGYKVATACNGVPLTRSRWCIQDSVPTGQAAFSTSFCAYGDKVVSTLEKLFNIPAPGVFEFELDTQTGGAHTGTACGTFGSGTAYDAFTGSAYGTAGFWGYLLTLHEAINVWTEMAATGWPTDWWADHQSAFPNLMDFHIMNTIGIANNDQKLIAAGKAQKMRFYPGGDSADPKVVALDNVFAAMPNGDGYAGFSHMFALQVADGVKWDHLGVPNPDVKRSEYVVAYMSLAAGKSVLKILQGPGNNGGGGICNNTPNGTAADKPYTCSQAHVDAIATAHCSVAANSKPSADLTALRSGRYADVPSGPCGASCPGECGCNAANHCVAPWLGVSTNRDVAVAGSGATDGDTSGTSGTGTAGTRGDDAPARGDARVGRVPTSDGARSSQSGCSCRASTDHVHASGLAGVLTAAALATVAARRRQQGQGQRAE